jgi:hypothetical protein
MKTIFTGLLGLTILALSGGCTVEERGPRERVEVIPARPSPRHVWVAGHYDERGGRTWVEGRWVLP